MVQGTARIHLRRVQESDALFLWHLTNDPVVRASSFSTTVISWEDHIKWLRTQLNDQSCIFLVALIENNIPIGQVRFDVTGDKAIISISIKKEYRDRGFGTILLSVAVDEIFHSTKIKKVHGYVKVENRSSISAFLKANFKNLGMIDIKGYKALHLAKERIE